MLCCECFELIIHPHEMTKSKIPKGCGAPAEDVCEKVTSLLKNCSKCRKKIVTTKDRFEYTDRNHLTLSLCSKCYDESNLETKKKYRLMEGKL